LSDRFCEEQANVFENLDQFYNLLRRGGRLKKTGVSTMFYFGLYIFPNNFMHFGEKKLKERKRKQNKKKTKKKKYLEAKL